MPPSYQTVRLDRGRHHDPAQGACVMELASMLAGERFSDHPNSVCPAIAAFLRGYNDTVDEELRQGLYAPAAAVLATRGGHRTTAQRTTLCHAFGEAAYCSRRIRLPWAYPIKGRHYGQICLSAGVEAARAALRDEAWHRATLALVERLAASGREPGVPPAIWSRDRRPKQRLGPDELACALSEPLPSAA